MTLEEEVPVSPIPLFRFIWCPEEITDRNWILCGFSRDSSRTANQRHRYEADKRDE